MSVHNAVHLLHIVAFLDLLAVGIIVPLVPSHVRNMGGSHITIGALGSIYAFFQFGSGPFIGCLSDLKGRRNILIMTLSVCALAYTILGLTGSVAVILFIRAILGLFKQTQILTKALVADYEKDQTMQSATFGKLAAVSGMGITLGPIIGGHIAEDFPPEHSFKIIGMLVGTCFALNAYLTYNLPEVNANRQSKQEGLQQNITLYVFNSIKQSFKELYSIKWSVYWDIFLLKGLIGFAMSVYYSNYSLYLLTKYHLSKKHIGYVISFQGVIGTLSSFCMEHYNKFYVSDEDFSLRNLHVFVLLCSSLVGIILSFNIYIYAIWIIPMAMGNAIGRLITLEMVLKRCEKEHKGTMIGASNSVRSLVGMVAPMVSGLVGEYFGVSYVVYVSLFSTTIGLIISYHYKTKKIKKY